MSEQQGFPPRLYGDNTQIELDGKKGSMWFATPKRCAETDYEYLSVAEHEALLAEAVREANVLIKQLLEEDICCGCGYYDALDYNGEPIIQTCAKCRAEEFIKAASTEGGKGGDG